MVNDQKLNLEENEEIDRLPEQCNEDLDSFFDPISNLVKLKIHFLYHYLHKQYVLFHYTSKHPFREYYKPKRYT